MFRIIKRSPWIALGAVGAWILDPVQGPQRRAMITTKARQWKDELISSRPSKRPFEPPLGTVGSDFADPTFAQRSA
jgi:hypothetical protein